MSLSRVIILVLATIVFGLLAFAQSNNSDTVSVVSAVAPPYPPLARQANAKGDATVEVEINADGGVASVESKTGHPILRKVSEEAARRWMFSSGSSKRKVTLTFTFRTVPANSSVYDGTAVYYPAFKIEVRAIESLPIS